MKSEKYKWNMGKYSDSQMGNKRIEKYLSNENFKKLFNKNNYV